MPTPSTRFDFPMGTIDADGRRNATDTFDGDGYYVAQDFGVFADPTDSPRDYHLGEDWNAEGREDLGDPVYAISSGTVVFAADGGTGWGNVVILKHDLPESPYGGFVTSLYGHLGELDVALNDEVDIGDTLGVIGPAQGISTAPHLHLEIRDGINPDAESVGAGYSERSEPVGWIDPTDFINANREVEATSDGPLEGGETPENNERPVVTAVSSEQILSMSGVARADDWWSASDPNGDTVTWLSIYDDNADPYSAFFSIPGQVWTYGQDRVSAEDDKYINGNIIPAKEFVAVTAEQFSDLTIQAGGRGLTDHLYVIAWDGVTWGEWAEIDVTTDVAGDDGSSISIPPVELSVPARANTSVSGAFSNNRAADPAISDNGRFVAFTSEATDLVSGDTNNAEDVFVKDLLTGEITRVSVGINGLEANGPSYIPSISGDGQRVAFASDATNIVSGDTNGLPDVFVFDLATQSLTQVSGSDAGPRQNVNPAISADGAHVVFVNGNDGSIGGEGPVFSRNLATGELTRITSDNDLLKNPNPYKGNHPDISSDGRYVSFGRNGDGPMIRDVETGQFFSGIIRPDGSVPDIFTTNPTSLSGDGRYVLFSTRFPGLVADDVDTLEDVFVKDLVTGDLTRVSWNKDGFKGNGDSSVDDSGGGISNDGRFVVFSSEATNLVAEDDATRADLFVKDLVSGEVARFSQSGLAIQTSGGRFPHDWDPVISADGRYIAFEAFADDFSTGDPAAEAAAFRKDIFVFQNPLIEDDGTTPPLGTVDTVANDTGTTAVLAAGQTVSGTIDQDDLNGSPIDADYYRISLTGGHSYTLAGNADVSTSDTLDAIAMRLRDATGNVLSPDIFVDGTSPSFSFDTPGTGNATYYLAVSAGGNGAFEDKTGDFTVALTNDGPVSPPISLSDSLQAAIASYGKDARPADYDRLIKSWQDPLTGLFAQLYQRTDGSEDYILAFAGTDFASLGDWVTNANVGWPQWKEAKKQNLLDDIGSYIGEGKSLHITGHSLGGALAQFATYEIIERYYPGQQLSDVDISLITWNGLGGEAGLRQNSENFDPNLLNGLRVEHYAHPDDIVARLGNGHVGGETYFVDLEDPFTVDFLFAHGSNWLKALINNPDSGPFRYFSLDIAQHEVAQIVNGIFSIRASFSDTTDVGLSDLKDVLIGTTKLSLFVGNILSYRDVILADASDLLNAIVVNITKVVCENSPTSSEVCETLEALIHSIVYTPAKYFLELSTEFAAFMAETIETAIGYYVSAIDGVGNVIDHAAKIAADGLLWTIEKAVEAWQAGVEWTDSAIDKLDTLFNYVDESFTTNNDAGGIYVTTPSVLNATGGVGRDVLLGNEYDNRLAGGLGGDLYFTGGGADAVLGTPEHLNNDDVDDFANDDSVTWLDVLLGLFDFQGRDGSMILDVDVNGDGEADSSISLDGDFNGRLVTEQSTGNTTIRFVSILADGKMIGTAGDDIIAGSRESDVIVGGDGGDQIVAREGEDLLQGGSGDDRLLGGPGADSHEGGEGSDVFVGKPIDLNSDVILDFTSEDILSVEGVRFSADDLSITKGSAILDIDTDGDGVKDTTITLDGDFPGTFIVTPSAEGGEAFTDITYQEPTALSLSLSIAPSSISENGGKATATLTRDSATVGDLEVTLASDDPSEATVPQSVTIPNGSDSVTFTVMAVDDTIVDGVQTAIINASAEDYTEASTSLNVTDNDSPPSELPVVSITPLNVDQDEGDAGTTAFTFTINRMGEDLSAANSVEVAFESGASDVDDFDGGLPGVETVTFSAGETARQVTLLVAGDETVEPDETFTLTLRNAVAATVSASQGTANGTIFNDDSGPLTNLAPVADDDNYTIDEDGTLTVAAQAGVLNNDIDEDGEALTASVVAGPESGDLTLNSDGGFSYFPYAEFNGGDSFIYEVDDGDGGTDTATAAIIVKPVPDAPEIVSDPMIAAVVGEIYSYDVDATDADIEDVLAYSLGAVADGMTIDPDTGTISWMPSAAGSFDVVVVATDIDGLTDEQSFSIDVEAAPETRIPVTVTFQSEHAAYDNGFGVYFKDTMTAELVAANLDQTPEGTVVYDAMLSEAEVDTLGFFLLPDGHNENDDLAALVGEPLMVVATDDGFAVSPNGIDDALSGKGAPAFFSDPALNPTRLDHFSETGSPTQYHLAIEDLVGGGDRDFNDAEFEIEIGEPVAVVPNDANDMAAMNAEDLWG